MYLPVKYKPMDERLGAVDLVDVFAKIRVVLDKTLNKFNITMSCYSTVEKTIVSVPLTEGKYQIVDYTFKDFLKEEASYWFKYDFGYGTLADKVFITHTPNEYALRINHILDSSKFITLFIPQKYKYDFHRSLKDYDEIHGAYSMYGVRSKKVPKRVSRILKFYRKTLRSY